METEEERHDRLLLVLADRIGNADEADWPTVIQSWAAENGYPAFTDDELAEEVRTWKIEIAKAERVLRRRPQWHNRE